jgi:hypothetical protein
MRSSYEIYQTKAYWIGDGSNIHGTDEKGKYLDRKSKERQALMEGKKYVKSESGIGFSQVRTESNAGLEA